MNVWRLCIKSLDKHEKIATYKCSTLKVQIGKRINFSFKLLIRLHYSIHFSTSFSSLFMFFSIMSECLKASKDPLHCDNDTFIKNHKFRMHKTATFCVNVNAECAYTFPYANIKGIFLRSFTSSDECSVSQKNVESVHILCKWRVFFCLLFVPLFKSAKFEHFVNNMHILLFLCKQIDEELCTHGWKPLAIFFYTPLAWTWNNFSSPYSNLNVSYSG